MGGVSAAGMRRASQSTWSSSQSAAAARSLVGQGLCFPPCNFHSHPSLDGYQFSNYVVVAGVVRIFILVGGMCCAASSPGVDSEELASG